MAGLITCGVKSCTNASNVEIEAPAHPHVRVLGGKRRDQILHDYIPGAAHSRQRYRDVRACQRLLHGPDRQSRDSTAVRHVYQDCGDILTLAQQPDDVDMVVALKVAP